MMNRYLTHFLAPAVFLGLFFFSCGRTGEKDVAAPDTPSLPDITVVATVNGDPITLGEFIERFTRAGFKLDGSVDVQIKEEFLNRLIERKMMIREAQRKRIKVGLSEINQRISGIQQEHGKDLKEDLLAQGIDYEKWKADIWENLMIEKLLDREVNRHANVSAAEIRRFYQSNPERFKRPNQVRVRQIVVSTENEAEGILEQLHDGANFIALAKEKSTAPEASAGGDLGYFARGEMPSEFNVVFALQKNELSSVVKSPYGFHIFRLEDRRPAGMRGFDEVTAEISKTLLQEKQNELFRKWMKELRSRTKFEVNYQALKD